MKLHEWAHLNGIVTTPDNFLTIRKKFIKYGIKEYPYKLIKPRHDDVAPDVLKSQDLVYYSDWSDLKNPKSLFYFKHEEDLIMFKLKWI